ncbi:cell filamentation protein Fic [Lactobacillus allii] [Lactiplantibacillus mudanjiangensis]|nr:cell filamentation protein Fic [Lactobacillus allii] [Lactiplantibacillus mudanjiangensis]
MIPKKEVFTLKKFDYKTLNGLVLTSEIVSKMNQIYEIRGQLSSIDVNFSDTLTRLVDVAKIQSTEASNAIEGIYTSDTRLKQIVQDKTQPHNRSEEEISGYRDVLDLIHEHYEHIKIEPNSILALHKQLFAFTSSEWRGHFKNMDNTIVTEYADGHKEIRFNPPAAYLTPGLVEELCHNYNDAMAQSSFSPLILSGAFIFDFVSIHPFLDGNGRMSRLLMLLTLYQSGFSVGKYISIEKLIEKTKEFYYEKLRQSSESWTENQNDYQPFIDYFLGVILQAYIDLRERVGIVERHPTSASDLIIRQLQQKLQPLSRRDLVGLIPQYSEVTLKRALASLHKDGRIELIGAGRASKYVLK